ncbi:lytic murein transglycosylase [Aliarcobacter trophiarum LMG 25534]|uniref:Lytic murein transglycosylase n=1 Tax=Aliarcobacter trophiarum LMG 25534 TaxID=1032241 RepID=A0AAD0VMC7_9BACT|nr:lytic transglycosylase domain-containing protein [Aliarcobacter trophiarum]AXK48750.1 soluble lytic murein transglycosylase [Aliarcobacter trophiarum LMG 25534]RXI25075.1 lytic murein transglycosylase [Aliarcobacter trophiarum]RXJ92073.1 lytic murein transglycosylase [Aliarcobacter trophiarum LMG 25534]
MLKIFRFSLLFSLSLNLFADSINTDFMQKDFKITFEWLEEKPKSSAKDFFILQYLQDEELSYENAKKAYDMRNGRNALLDKSFKQKFNEKISPEDRFCYNASILELKNSDSRCIALGLASLKKASNLSKSDLAFFISKLDTYPTLKNNLILISSNDVFKKLINSSSDKFLEIFFEVSDEYRYKYLNQNINSNFLHKIAINKDFEKFLRTVIYDKKLNNIQKSLDNLKTDKTLTANLQFLLGINAVNNRKLESAKEFFQNSFDIAYLRGEKDKALFWLYLLSKNTLYLEELTKSFEANIYSLYAKEILNIVPDNLVFKIDMQIKPSSYDIYDVFSWLEVTEDSKKSLDDEKMQKYLNLFTQKNMEPHLAFLLERYNRFKNQYFITPYEDLLSDYGIYKKILIYSIAKQESRFIPSSISFSSAMGIMQIMPFLSKDIANKLGDNYNIYEQFIPEKNIQYASFHLDSLMKQFDSNPLFIAYAYNGGAGYTRSQLKKGLFKEKSEFEPFLSMEMISYNETREYGKKVLANFYIYNNYLNSENKISLSSIFQNLVWHH